jgi:hypothetical protein
LTELTRAENRTGSGNAVQRVVIHAEGVFFGGRTSPLEYELLVTAWPVAGMIEKIPPW